MTQHVLGRRSHPTPGARRRRMRVMSALLAVSALVAASGCSGISQLQFRVDKRLHFTAPVNRAKLTLPVQLAWTIKDFDVLALGAAPPSRHAGLFALFVDRSPLRPGQSLSALADASDCRGKSNCPDAAYLADRQVFLTTETSFTVKAVPNLAGKEKEQLHTVIIVLVDTSGRRIGETAFQIQFKAPRRGVL